jgi:ATP-dependent DNA helicase RecG
VHHARRHGTQEADTKTPHLDRLEGRQISPSDIYRVMKTDDRNTYDKEVTSLRKSRILKEIRTNPAAAQYAKANNISKDKVPRFEIHLPSNRNTASDIQEKTIYVTNLPFTIIDVEVRNLFDAFGAIKNIHLLKDANTGNLIGGAFIEFLSEESAQKALLSQVPLILKGRTLFVKKALKRNAR